MNKTDKQKIAESYRAFQAGAARCANACYNASQHERISANDRQSMGEAVRAHDAARNRFVATLRQFGILPP